VGGPAPDCDDGNDCTDDGCDPASGCQNTPLASGSPCGDGNVCNGDETCQEGVCTDGTPLDCDDGNICTDNGCDQTEGCLEPTPNTTACPLQLVSAKKLTVKVKPTKAKKNKLVVLFKGAFGLPSPGDDPTIAGATLRVRDSGGQDVEFPLPGGSWKAKGSNRLIYKDAKRMNGPCTKVTVKAGKLIKATCKGDQIGLVLPLSDPVRVILRMGNTSYCAAFGGNTKRKTASFVAKAALGSVDCSAAFYAPGSVPEGF
jgi:hypothetical protein